MNDKTPASLDPITFKPVCEIEELPNNWLYERLLELEGGEIHERVLFEAVRRAFGDYMTRVNEESY